MEQKDPKDMTAAEQLRWAANGEPYNGIDENIWTCPTGKIKALAEAVTGEWPSDNEIFSIVADKIDVEMANARRICLDHVANLWAKDNGWPDFREGEDFGAWLDRCALKRPCYEDGEPVRDSSEWKAIMMSLDGSRFQLLKSYPDGLCFTGSPVKRPDPDTQERIDEDAQKSNQSYWGCEGRSCKVCPAIIDGAKPCERYDVFSCEKAKTLDLLRRQRELDARKGGAE